MALVRVRPLSSMTWWIGVGFAALSVTALVVGRGYGVAGIMPSVASWAILGLSLLHTVHGLLFGVIANDEDWHSPEERRDYSRRRWAFVAIALGLGVSVWVVGFFIALPVFLVLFIGLTLGRWMLGVALGAVMLFFTYVILGQVLHVAFPPTLLRTWLIANGYF